jgi:hypothetical protein
MALSQSLKGCKGVGHSQEVSLGIEGFEMIGYLFYYELTDTAVIQILNVAMTIVTLSLQGKKQSLFWEAEATAICEQPTNLCFGVSISSRTNKRGDFFDTVFHDFKITIFPFSVLL